LAAVNFNTTLNGAERADAILLVGTNPRWEAPLLNTRIRKARKRGAKVFAIGPETDLTYKVEWLGDDLSLLGALPDGVTELFGKTERPMIVLGGLAVKRAHGAALALAERFNLVREGWNGFNVLHFSASRMGSLMLSAAQPGGIADLVAAKPKLAFFLGADEVDFSKFADSFKVYLGHHGDRGAAAADVVLPGAAYSEKAGTWVNLEGRVQRGERAVFAPGDAREDWTVLRALSEVMGVTLPFDSFAGLREAMFNEVPALRHEGLATFDWAPPELDASVFGTIDGYPVKDFYLTNAICRASPTMQRCSQELVHGQDFAEAAE
jgi:NADH-quinone oxidoreductase subunit G